MTHSKHIDHKALAARLQSEVDAILSTVEQKDAQGLFAEFKINDIVDISGTSDKPVITESIDERIMIRLNERSRTHSHPILEKTGSVGKKVHKAVNYLFKPFEI